MSFQDPTTAQVAWNILADSAPVTYLARENARAQAMRTPADDCETCGAVIFEDPGYCTLCAWDAA